MDRIFTPKNNTVNYTIENAINNMTNHVAGIIIINKTTIANTHG